MHDNRWIGWLGLIILFLIFQAVRAMFRAAKSGSNDGMARLNAAAERILKERGASASNPIPRTNPMGTKPVSGKPLRSHGASAKPRSTALLPKSSTPAVIRRNGILSGGREPVVQRRR